MIDGTLSVYITIAGQAAPLSDVVLTVYDEAKTVLDRQTTDELGKVTGMTLSAPDSELSLEQSNSEIPYGKYCLKAEKEGWQTAEMEDIQIFGGQETIARIEMLPTDEALAVPLAEDGEPVVIPAHSLTTGDGGSGREPQTVCENESGRVLQRVVIPKTVTVHLGKPTADAQNVTVPFQTYIANVASREVYPTWPEEALKANILAQISLVLNRIYTEWYLSRGFDFTITNNPGYDQAYTHGGTVYAVMERLTAELFDTYCRKTGSAEPYFTEYCDGKLVTCPGMKQWGTVDRAREGMTALEILRYYYGDDLNLVTSDNFADIPESYPGKSLKKGDTGEYVSILQRQLARIGKSFPGFGQPDITGEFDTATENSVKAFQKYYSLTVDGIVGRTTWYKISLIYVSVKELAQLTSEGEEITGAETAGTWQGTTLKKGSTGTEVELLQFWLSELSQMTEGLPSVTVDGSFGSATETAVKAFQLQNGIASDGVVGKNTWDAIYNAWVNMQSDAGGTAYPGTPLKEGSKGNNTRLVQFWLYMAATNYAGLSAVAVDGRFGSATTEAVEAFQNLVGLTSDGVVGRQTWNKLREIFLAVANNLVETNVLPGTFTGTLQQGSTGIPVRALQYYLNLLSAYYINLPSLTVDGSFGAATTAAVKAWQEYTDLTADGIVGALTWESIYTSAQNAAANGPVARAAEPMALSDTIKLGDSGTEVKQLSEMLLFLGQWLPEITLWQDGQPIDVFDETLETAVRSAQKAFGLEETGEVTSEDWQVFYDAAAALYTASPASAKPEPDDVWPGYTLTVGSAGPAVLQIQKWLNALACVFCGFPFVEETGIFDEATKEALLKYQMPAGLEPLGVVEINTWNALKTLAAKYRCSKCGSDNPDVVPETTEKTEEVQ